ncbi:ABC transporter ATP-binding protein [uncultured Roseobacter sp.]|uniref:ABC transporter ATP-binding protein n=1 Tax=uncultured Roseobacter sp. TaxID=114847 RepID=UPI00260B5BAC|nr:ABC transporter ATP-binding protein [uncultured Roseobacter sp.]
MSLTAHGLRVSFGARTVLCDTGFDMLRAGQLTALIGPNAAGKSTLFRAIAGLVRTDAGGVHLDGRDLSELSLQKRLKHICFMPQFFTANAALSVFDVVLMAQKQLAGWRVSQNDMTAVARALNDAGIGHLANANIGELSGGQSQMVSVCQALIRRSDVYLFDEPTSALDLRHQLDVMARIKQAMVARNAIGVVALHDLNLAARFADHILLIGSGEVLAQGTPDKVLSDPLIALSYDVTIQTGLGPREELNVHAYAD